jgi:NDP-sugar pyrophosphorylase family protein
VLAGTYQWARSAFDTLCPRPLLPVAQRPLIDYALDWLHGAGVREAILCANGSTAALRRHIEATDSSLHVSYQEDDSPRGAAGCIKDAAALSVANTFVVTDGTSVPTADIARLLAWHHHSGADLTIVVRARPSTGQPHLEPTGTYVFRRDVLEAVPATSFQDIKETLIPKMYREGRRIELFAIEEVSPRVLNATTYLAANRWMIQRLAAGDPNANECVAHPSASIDPTATIVGPVIIGQGARVHGHATIVGPTSIGPHTIIEQGAVVTRSVAWEHCVIGRGAVVDQSLMSDHAVIAPHSHVLATVRTSAAPTRNWMSSHFGGRKSTVARLMTKPATR